MIKYVLKRLILMIPVLFLITVFTFIIVHLAPGDPANLFTSPNMTQQQIDFTYQKLGLDQPLVIQYFKWFFNLLKGDLGYSFNSRMDITYILPTKIIATLQLMGATVVFSYVIAIPLGILAARYKNTWFDNLMTTFTFLGVSIPNFFLGLALIYIFALQFKLLPTGGMITLGGVNDFADRFRHIILPTVVLSTSYMANMIRHVRSSMIEVFSENYIRTAVAKGLPDRKIVIKHGLKNILVPIITIISTDIPKLLGGALVTEQIFLWPGIGMMMMSAINTRDYPVLMALTLLAAIAVQFFNLFADIMYAVVDPRIRY